MSAWAMRHCVGCGFGAAVALAAGAAGAAENGAGFYLLGSRGPLAAVLPPTGVYLQNDFYLLDAAIGASKQLPLAGNIALGVDGAFVLDVPTVSWVTPLTLLGGRTALTASLPLGYAAVNADVTLGQLRGSVFDDVATVGDPVLGGQLGWDAGRWHWTLGTLVNVPIGDYQDGELANIAFHRWGADVNGGLTFFDPSLGTEASAVVGVTFNGENPETDYRTGTEFHVEGSLSKFFTPLFSLGVVGYAYDQITGDSGKGARLGDFEGRVAALGLTAAYNFEVAGTPLTARIKVFREFEARNRPTGTSAFLTVAFPLQH